MSISPIQSSIPWTSPIKPPSPPGEPPTIVPQRLFESKQTNTPPSYQSLSIQYEVDFFQPPPGSTIKHFFDMRECVLQIETHLYGHPSHSIDLDQLRVRIKSLIKNATLDPLVKLGELGLILFYLDYPDRLFPADEPSLIALRANEMKREATRLIQAHAAITTDARIPSGRTHYLLRSFAHMALTSTGVYNLGGLYALKTILESPEFTLASFLEAEHHTHILVILNQLLNQSGFEALFKRHIEVHPDLQNVIRIDLKLRPEDPICSTHVFWDCLMFLFTDIRQIYRPNCYAIGALIYATENAAYKTLDALLKWLTQGHYESSDGISVPLRPILEKRLIYAQDLKIELETQKALSLNTFQHIMERMHADSSSSSSSEVAPLRTILNAASAPSHIPYIESLYYAYKYNALVHLALAIMEFTWNNTSLEHTCIKESFTNWIFKRLSVHLKSQFPGLDFTPFTHAFHSNLNKKIWFENCSETDIALSRRGLRVGKHCIKNFAGSLKQLKQTFEDSLRLFYLEGNKYGLIGSFSDFKDALVEIAQDSYPSTGLNVSVLASALFFFRSHTLTQQLARHAAKQIDLPGIQGSALLKSNLLVCRQQYGYPEDVLQKVFDLPVAIHAIRGQATAYHFLGALRSNLKRIEKTVFKSIPRLVAFTRGSHIWTLSPSHLQVLVEPNLSYHRLLQTTIFAPARRHLQKKIPKPRWAQMVRRLGLDRGPFTFSNDFTYERVRTILLSTMQNNRPGPTMKAIDDEFEKILTTDINMTGLFARLGIRPSSAKWYQIKSDLGHDWLPPYQIAQKLREALIRVGEKILDPYEIEIALCQQQGFPLSYNIGDLNWTEGPYRENPSHIYLVVRYNWAQKILCYYTRYRKKERIENNDAFQHFEIQHPYYW